MNRTASALWLLWTTFCTGAFCTLGCGSSGPNQYRVTGQVTWEGAPLPDGDILFEPTEGGVPAAGKIQRGEFSLLATAGVKKVSIIATRPKGEVDPSMGMPPRESYIPTRYNDQSELTFEVTAAGPNRCTFALTSSAP